MKKYKVSLGGNKLVADSLPDLVSKVYREGALFGRTYTTYQEQRLLDSPKHVVNQITVPQFVVTCTGGYLRKGATDGWLLTDNEQDAQTFDDIEGARDAIRNAVDISSYPEGYSFGIESL